MSGILARLPGVLLTTLAVLMLGFVAHVAVISKLEHDRAQQIALASFRIELANATAPTGQTDADTSRLYPVGTPMAILEIPTIGLWEVVVEGASAETLMVGPGHRRDTRLPGQAGTVSSWGGRRCMGGHSGV